MSSLHQSFLLLTKSGRRGPPRQRLCADDIIRGGHVEHDATKMRSKSFRRKAHSIFEKRNFITCFQNVPSWAA